MATAQEVPETASMREGELSGEDAAATLRRIGRGRLIKDSMERFRAADGSSFARAVAYQLCLTTIPLAIAVVGLASLVHAESLSKAVQETVLSLAPGSSSDVVKDALKSAGGSGGAGGALALVFGLITSLVSLTFTMVQIERGANRIYGAQTDRPTKQRYAHGALLGLTAGLPALFGFVVLVAGRAAIEAFGKAFDWSDWAVTALVWLRWPLGAVLCWMALTVIFQRVPQRRQPAKSWLAFGAGVALVLWLVFSGLLALYVSLSSGFSELYGPLTAVIALLLWAQFTAVALLYGLAFAAQLEHSRAGRRPVDRVSTGA